MRIPFKKLVLGLALPALLAGCNGFFEKDNTPTPAPLMKFTPSAQPQLRWSTSAGSSISDDYLRMNPALGRRAVLVASNNGNVSAIDKLSGKTLWRTDTHCLNLVNAAYRINDRLESFYGCLHIVFRQSLRAYCADDR